MSRFVRTLAAAAALGLGAAPLAAQSSQFGSRGLGVPLRPLSVRGFGTGGAFGSFDVESAFNPASIGLTTGVSAAFQTVQSWRHSESPAGSGSARDNRFPGVMVVAPVGGTNLAVSLSASGYTDRNVSLVSQDTIILRDVPVGVFDTLTSEGGISDLRAAVAWRQSRSVQWGLGLHLITGSNRIRSKRAFSDTVYTGASERATISYLGVGASAGVVARVNRFLSVAGMIRADNRVRVERDTNDLGTTRLPVTVAGAVRLQLSDRLMIAGGGTFRNWSASNDDLIAQDGIGSRNTMEWNAGIEFLKDPKRPFHRPLRLGFRRAGLPFPLFVGQTQHETGISAGTSFRFVADRAGVDIAVERVWRDGGPGYKETAFLLNLGISVRP